MKDIETGLKKTIRENIQKRYHKDLLQGSLWPSFKGDIIKDTHSFLGSHKTPVQSIHLKEKTQCWIASLPKSQKSTVTIISLKEAGFYSPSQQDYALKELGNPIS